RSRKNRIANAAASATTVSSRARSAPFQYGLEVSASQKMCLSKLANTSGSNLLHITHRNLLLLRQHLQRAVLLQRFDRGSQRRAELRIRLAVVDPERIGLREEIRDRQLAGIVLLLVRAGGVLRQHRVGPPEQDLGDRVLVPGIALQVHLRLARRLELIVQALEIVLVLRRSLNRDVLPG